MTYKRLIYQCLAKLSMLSAIALTGCGANDSPDEPIATPDNPGAHAPSWIPVAESDCSRTPDWEGVYPAGDDTNPAWTLPDLSIFPTSMSAVIGLSDRLQAFAGPDDLLGAFINGECRGLGVPSQVNGKTLWFMVFKGAEGETAAVELRYFSARLRRVYTVKDCVAYRTNGSYGDLSNPAIPDFESHLFLSGNVYIGRELRGYSTVNDRLAVFVGEECRGTAMLVGNGVYCFDAFMLPGEEFSFRYYNARLGYLFSSNTDSMTAGRVLGSAANPYTVDFGLDRCHPLKVRFTLRLPADISPSEQDVVGIFVGDECRGTSVYSAELTVDARASLTSESYVVRYYHHASDTYYRSREPLPMPTEDAGTPDDPLTPELTIMNN